MISGTDHTDCRDGIEDPRAPQGGQRPNRFSLRSLRLGASPGILKPRRNPKPPVAVSRERRWLHLHE